MPAGQAGDLAARLQTSPPMVVLRPGDRVLVTLTEDPGAEECQHVAAELRKAFPGVDVTVLAGVASICVQGGQQPWPEPASKPPTQA